MPDEDLELTPDQIKNGWTPAKLRDYIDQAERSAARRVFGDQDQGRRNPPARVVNCKTFNPHRY